MDMMKGESIKNLIKNGTPCSSILKHTSRVFVALGSLAKRKSWSCRTSNSTSICERKKNKARRIAPAGYFAVYVGPEKQRFVVKTEFSNHPLFKLLLEDAALEYGYKNDGPLLLPCDVDLFSNVLAEMEGNIHEDMISPKSWSSIQIFLGPARARPSDFRMNEGCGGGYRLLNKCLIMYMS